MLLKRLTDPTNPMMENCPGRLLVSEDDRASWLTQQSLSIANKTNKQTKHKTTTKFPQEKKITVPRPFTSQILVKRLQQNDKGCQNKQNQTTKIHIEEDQKPEG